MKLAAGRGWGGERGREEGGRRIRRELERGEGRGGPGGKGVVAGDYQVGGGVGGGKEWCGTLERDESGLTGSVR